MTWKHWIGVLIALAIIAGVAAFSNIDANAQDMDPDLLEAYAALERPTEAQLEQGREWQRAGSTGLLRLPGPRLRAMCGEPLGCIVFSPGTSSKVRPFCTVAIDRDLPEFMMTAVIEVRMAECGRILTVVNN